MARGYPRSLTDEQVAEGKRLRLQEGYSKSELAELFGVGMTTIWENVFATTKRIRQKSIRKAVRERRECVRCARCEICMTFSYDDNLVPMSLMVGGTCLSCYMRGMGIDFNDILQ